MFYFNRYKKFIVLYIFIVFFSPVFAGSYEDFFSAIERDDAPAVAQLIRLGFDPNTPSPQGLHPLFAAINAPAPKVAHALAQAPATKVDLRNAHDETPLMMASIKGMDVLVKLLIDRDADVNKTAWTPLHYAASNSRLVVMNMLLDHHAYIDAPSPNGTTPLMMAAMYGSPSAVKLLLEAGADPTIKNDLGLSAIDFALRDSKQESAALIQAFLQARSK
jgi:ankyrin repeat protein